MIFPARLPSLLDGSPRDVDVLDPVAVQQRGQRTLAYAALLAVDHVLAEKGEPLRPEVALPAEVPGSHLGASHVHAVRGLDLRPCEVEGVHELVGEDSSELEGRPQPVGAHPYSVVPGRVAGAMPGIARAAHAGQVHRRIHRRQRVHQDLHLPVAERVVRQELASLELPSAETGVTPWLHHNSCRGLVHRRLVIVLGKGRPPHGARRLSGGEAEWPAGGRGRAARARRRQKLQPPGPN
mmetsp:Transcript_69202/g.175884  ORF Transcript_69202/g.175884 Transcript_69202/m.175884 type:complete len:238 (+) Transcript_69202:303-1016(+)